MLVWVLYDISNDRTRNRLAKTCLNKGLYRVQKSVFIGTLNKNERDEFSIMAEDMIDESTDSVYIFPSDRSMMETTELIGQGFDKELVMNEVVSRFF